VTETKKNRLTLTIKGTKPNLLGNKSDGRRMTEDGRQMEAASCRPPIAS